MNVECAKNEVHQASTSTIEIPQFFYIRILGFFWDPIFFPKNQILCGGASLNQTSTSFFCQFYGQGIISGSQALQKNFSKLQLNRQGEFL